MHYDNWKDLMMDLKLEISELRDKLKDAEERLAKYEAPILEAGDVIVNKNDELAALVLDVTEGCGEIWIINEHGRCDTLLDTNEWVKVDRRNFVDIVTGYLKQRGAMAVQTMRKGE